ncbi:MAG TPA: hypothetical protein VH253_11190 [Phycisphaerae bacterium]|nr:hypothetical protein [Phycisphaerae bacterium]
MTHDVTCRACGYNLRGLSPDGRCPECGQGIELSLLSDNLRVADGTWVAELARGLRCLRWAVACGLMFAPLFLVVLSGVRGSAWIYPVAGFLVAAGALGGVGCFLVTLGERRGALARTSRGQRVRLAARWVLMLGIPATTLFIAAPGPWPEGTGVVASGATLAVGGGALFVHLARLSRRARDQRLATTLYTLAILAAMCGVLLLVPQILAWAFGPMRPQGLPIAIVWMVGVLLSPGIFLQLGRLRAAMLENTAQAKTRRSR